jgi:hypothetical protein
MHNITNKDEFKFFRKQSWHSALLFRKYKAKALVGEPVSFELFFGVIL